MGVGTNVVRFVLKLANVVLLLLGLSMGLYALSTYSDFKKLKHNADNNVTLHHQALPPQVHQHHHALNLPSLSDKGKGGGNLNFLNNTKVPIYITGLGGAGVFTTLTAATGLYATDTGRPLCLNLYSLELLVMIIFQITVVIMIYYHKVYIPEEQKKSAEDSKFAKFLIKQEKIAKAMAMAILVLQLCCIMLACLLKRLKYQPRDEFDFDEDDYGGNRERHQPLLHFTEDRDDLGSPDSSKKNKRKAKKKGKQYESIRSKYYEDV